MITELLTDYNINYQTEGHKHCRPGWANMQCPFCTGNPGLHLGVSVEHGYWKCWRCGFHHQYKALSAVLNVSQAEAKALYQKYRIGRPGASQAATTTDKSVKVGQKRFIYPDGTGPLQRQHTKYLLKRKFDPEIITDLWGVQGTGPLADLDDIDYRHRIIIPISWGGRVVSFQGRDITDKSGVKYLACPQKREKEMHQNILYGLEDRWGDVGLLVEGVTDVWRLGVKTCACFGIEYSHSQLRLLSQRFKRLVVLFDEEIQAQKQADKLVADLCFRGVDAVKEIIADGDPGELDQRDADYLVKRIF